MSWWFRRRRERDFERELQAHLELEAEERHKNGCDEQQSQYAARKALGNTTLIKEDLRAVWSWVVIDRLAQDLRYALRTMRKSMSYSVVAVLTMSLGIASTTLIFALINSLLLQPLPFKDPDALYMFWEKIPNQDRVSFSPSNFVAYRSQTKVASELAAFTGNGFTILGRGEPELALGQLVTPSFFDILGVAPKMGRTFLPSEGEQGHNYEVVLSADLWKQKFDGRADVIGKPVVLNGESYTVIGVMPESFDFPNRDCKLWVPAALNAPFFQQHKDAHFLRVLARATSGSSIQRLQAEMDIIGRRIDAQDGDANRGYYVSRLRDIISGDVRRPLLVLMLAVTCLLVIAAANVANLSLARAGVRHRELAVRGAIGASRARLIQQLIIESTSLAVVGGIVGSRWRTGDCVC
jgi:predicted permease